MDALEESVDSLENDIAEALAAQEAPEETEEQAEAEGEAQEASPEEPAPPQEEERLLPQDHWKREYKDAFVGMSRTQQEQWLAREKEYSRGHESRNQELKQAKAFIQELHGIIEPSVNDWHRQGVNVDAGLRRAIAIEKSLREDPLQAIKQIAQERGLDLQQAWAEEPYQDPAIRALNKQIAEQADQLRQFQTQQQTAQQQLEAQQRQEAVRQIEEMRTAVDESGNPEFPYFEDLIPQMTNLLNTGQAASVPNAYKLAVQSVTNHPLVRERMAQTTQQTAETRTKEAEKAQAASKAVDSNSTGTVKPKSLDEDILEELERAGLE